MTAEINDEVGGVEVGWEKGAGVGVGGKNGNFPKAAQQSPECSLISEIIGPSFPD